LLEVAPKAIGRSVETEHLVGAIGSLSTPIRIFGQMHTKGKGSRKMGSCSPNQKERAKNECKTIL